MTSAAAPAVVVERVRERLRAERADPARDPEFAAQIARAEVRRHNDFALARGLATVDDETACVRDVLATVACGVTSWSGTAASMTPADRNHGGRTHPLTRARWGNTALTWSGATVAQLTRGRSDWVASVLRDGLRPFLITPPSSRVSVGMLTALRATRGDWLMDDGSRLRRLNGDPVKLPDRWNPLDPAAVSGGSPQYDGWTGRVLDAAQISVSVHHRADAGAVIGRPVEAVLGEDAGWGLSEPVTRAWDSRALTEVARRRVPRPTRFFARSEAGGAAGLVRRTDSGVFEEWKFVLPSASAPDAVAALRVIATRQDVLLGTAWACAAGDDASVGPELAAGLRPLAAVVGPRALRRSPWSPDPQIAQVEWVGSRPRMRTLLVDTTASSDADLAMLLRGVDPDLLARGLGATPDAE
ncbi:DUF6177 family protein [Microbacterium sp. BWT-B31]|uniref:DUF6177 family protein n=1 Tax=Microbacterium sp. BWT-B31 TaxID=3232072 RepID=UPI0035277817